MDLWREYDIKTVECSYVGPIFCYHIFLWTWGIDVLRCELNTFMSLDLESVLDIYIFIKYLLITYLASEAFNFFYTFTMEELYTYWSLMNFKQILKFT